MKEEASATWQQRTDLALVQGDANRARLERCGVPLLVPSSLPPIKLSSLAHFDDNYPASHVAILETAHEESEKLDCHVLDTVVSYETSSSSCSAI